ncbi:hypothetical protein BV133_1623 [Blastochloris viridis]|uniref:Uncharacterized protein n=1 Tax=Blastochloris viridis TaxID=1079 RepID=A0A182D135_BLAVI|nr:hypothetical protein BV133_1623 [Blastochloris viridis]
MALLLIWIELIRPMASSAAMREGVSATKQQGSLRLSQSKSARSPGEHID